MESFGPIKQYCAYCGAWGIVCPIHGMCEGCDDKRGLGCYAKPLPVLLGRHGATVAAWWADIWRARSRSLSIIEKKKAS